MIMRLFTEIGAGSCLAIFCARKLLETVTAYIVQLGVVFTMRRDFTGICAGKRAFQTVEVRSFLIEFTPFLLTGDRGSELLEFTTHHFVQALETRFNSATHVFALESSVDTIECGVKHIGNGRNL